MKEQKEIFFEFISSVAEKIVTLLFLIVIFYLINSISIIKAERQEFIRCLERADLAIRQGLTDLQSINNLEKDDFSFLSQGNFLEEFSKVSSGSRLRENISGCFGSDYATKYQLLNGEKNGFGRDYGKCMIAADGTLYAYKQVNYAFQHGVSFDDEQHTVGWLAVDVNGEKGPNTWGRDVFLFDIATNKGLVYAGSFSSDSCNINNSGYECTYKVLKDGTMYY